jgi:peptidoglycan/xylan/chitin deacetylase (PgdA/CDA1 family)
MPLLFVIPEGNLLYVTPTESLALAAASLSATAAATLAYAALSPGSELFGPTLIAGNDPNEIALTYDDGPNPAATPQLLEMLARYNARATFFIIGEHARRYPDLVRALHHAGHLLGNHTMKHPWLAWQPGHVIREELAGCSKLIEDLTGEPVRFMRPPHGARRPAVMRIAKLLGMQTVQWNIMGFDWRPIGAEAILEHIDKGLRRAGRRRRGGNILLHDGHQTVLEANRAGTISSTAALLERYEGTSTRFVTVDAWG